MVSKRFRPAYKIDKALKKTLHLLKKSLKILLFLCFFNNRKEMACHEIGENRAITFPVLSL